MKYLVTGAAGFIGSNLVDRLLSDGHEVTGVDNLSTGRKKFLEKAVTQPRFTFFERDLYDPKSLDPGAMRGVDFVFHLAANADVKDGLKHPRKDLEQNTIVTWNVLEAMRANGVKKIGFSSTGSVYGEAKTIPTPEDCPFPVQTSLYGASKLSGESMIAAYAEGYDFKATIFRFVSILGERYTHGHVFDFVKKLKENPNELFILGDGKQRKSYLYVGDCVNAILSAIHFETPNRVEIYNLGTDEYTNVDGSVDVITKRLRVNPTRKYSGGQRGWVGDNPFIFLSCKKIQSTGWKAERTIAESVALTVDYLVNNPWVYHPEGQNDHH